MGLALEALELMCLTAVHREMSGAELEVQTGCKRAGCVGSRDTGAAHQECERRHRRRPANGRARALGSEKGAAVPPFPKPSQPNKAHLHRTGGSLLIFSPVFLSRCRCVPHESHPACLWKSRVVGEESRFLELP